MKMQQDQLYEANMRIRELEEQLMMARGGSQSFGE